MSCGVESVHCTVQCWKPFGALAQHLSRIARNQARLAALGIHEAIEELAATAPPKRVSKPKHVKRSGKEHTDISTSAAPPRRRSKRLRDQIGAEEPPEHETDADDDAGVNESRTQLASFIISGDCPKCGRVVTRGHKKHLEGCSGAPQRGKMSLADMIKAEMTKIKTDHAKLQQLELGGLIEFDDDHATFMVVGSTGNYYKIEFTTTKRKCQCVDHRIRKRDCKHIRLVLQSLNIQDEPDNWKSATASLVEQQADDLKHAKKQESRD